VRVEHPIDLLATAHRLPWSRCTHSDRWTLPQLAGCELRPSRAVGAPGMPDGRSREAATE